MTTRLAPLAAPQLLSRLHPVISRLREAVPDVDLAVIGDHVFPEGLIGGIRQSLRERFQAITGIGLSLPFTARVPILRHRVASRDGVPPLSYLAAGDPAGRRVVFVHGTPGNATDWQAFLHAPALNQHRLAIDRPGFGESGPQEPVISLSDQARAIAVLLESVGGPAVVVGSSYGGPVALRLAADHPDLVAGLLLVGGAADPGREQTHPLQRLAAAPAIAAMMPRALAHSNAELLALRGELEALADDIGRIQAPVTILHGLRDTLVPTENTAYVAERLKGVARKRVVLVAQAGHFLHLLARGHVEDALSDLLASTSVAHPVHA